MSIPPMSFPAYLGGCDILTNIRFYFTNSSVDTICGMRLGYSGAWTDVFGLHSFDTAEWERKTDEGIAKIDSTTSDKIGGMSGLKITKSSGEFSQYGDGNDWSSVYLAGPIDPFLIDFTVQYQIQRCVTVISPIWTNSQQSYTHSLILNTRPSSMRMSKILADHSTHDDWKDLFKAKQETGADASKALDFLVKNDEAMAWVCYGNTDTKDEVWICSDQDNLGQLYIWTRDIGTAKYPNHVTRIGHRSTNTGLLVSAEFSLTGLCGASDTGTSGAFIVNDPKKTSVAYKSWFTTYVKNKAANIRSHPNEALRQALVNAGIADGNVTRILKVQHGNVLYQSYAAGINAIFAGVWSVLQCEKYVKTIIKDDYLLIDTPNFDQTNGYVIILREGILDFFFGDDTYFVTLPKTETIDYPPSISVDKTTTVSFATNFFVAPESVTSYLTRAAVASFLGSDFEHVLQVFGFVCDIAKNTDKDNTSNAKLGLKYLSGESGLVGDGKLLADLFARVADYAIIESPQVILTLHLNEEASKVQKVSVIVGEYEADS